MVSKAVDNSERVGSEAVGQRAEGYELGGSETEITGAGREMTVEQ